MKKELEYRTFNELLDSVKIDLRTYDLEGMIDDQTLIKVAQRINYELGLKINPNKTKMLEVTNYRVKLPSDFYSLNHALLCRGSVEMHNPPLWSYKTYNQGVADGIYQAEYEIYRKMVQQYTQITTINPGLNTITHNLGTNYVIVQAHHSSDLTLLSFELLVVDQNTIQLISTNPDPIVGVIVTVMGAKSSNGENCPPDPCPIPPNPCVQNTSSCSSVSLTHDGNCPIVVNRCNGRTKKYGDLIRLQILGKNSNTADCINVDPRGYYTTYLKNGFLETNFKEGDVLIMYEGSMEDEDGNLLVLSHPYADEFYEYALKERIYENLAQAGENTSQLMQLMSARLREARNKALGFINTPDFGEMKQIWQMNRKALYNRFYDMFKYHMPHDPYYM